MRELSPMLVTLGLVAGLLRAQGETNVAQVKVDGFTVVGLQARSSNAQEASPSGVIGKLWGELLGKNLLAQIKNRVDDRVIAVYTDYESDHNGPYTYVLGAKVSSAKLVPPGMISRKVLAGRYGVFTDHGGPAPQMVVNLWRKIWSLESPDRLHRAYQTDFEVHSVRPGGDPEAIRVQIYIGLRNKS